MPDEQNLENILKFEFPRPLSITKVISLLKFVKKRVIFNRAYLSLKKEYDIDDPYLSGTQVVLKRVSGCVGFSVAAWEDFSVYFYLYEGERPGSFYELCFRPRQRDGVNNVSKQEAEFVKRVYSRINEYFEGKE